MYKFVIIRHGLSVWSDRFTGWTDIDLSERGLQEAKKAGELLKKEGFVFDLGRPCVCLNHRKNYSLYYPLGVAAVAGRGGRLILAKGLVSCVGISFVVFAGGVLPPATVKSERYSFFNTAC